MSTPEQRAEPHVARAIEEIIKGNRMGDGDYVIVIHPTCADGSIIYTWQWFWSPAAPVRSGRLP